MSVIRVTPAWQDLNAINFITIHTTASPFGKALTAAQISAIDQATYGQTSYHHVFELDGTDVQTLRYDQRGAHVGKHNTGNLGLSYVGGLGRDGKGVDTRTPGQKAAMAARVIALHKRYPNAAIGGHRDWSPDLNGNGRIDPAEWVKMCPCFDVAAWLREIGVSARPLPVIRRAA